MAIVVALRCAACGAEFPPEPMPFGCPVCARTGHPSNVACVYNGSCTIKLRREDFEPKCRGLAQYAALLPASPNALVSLGEGNTPLVHCPGLGKRLGIRELLVKDEARNPTWSCKDRLSAVSISKARELGARVVTASSTGNHGASTAAYASRAGLDCVIFTVPTVPAAMRTVMQAYGSKLVALTSYEDRWRLMRACIEAYGWYGTSNCIDPPIGSDPYGVEGYKTIAYELCVDLGWRAPDTVVVPVAYGDIVSGVWRGFTDLFRLGLIDQLPFLVAAEVYGSLGRALAQGLAHPPKVPETDSIAFSIATPITTAQALRTLRDAQGTAVTVSDAAIRDAQSWAAAEGFFVDASSATGFAAAATLSKSAPERVTGTVVIVSTSSGLKDPLTLASRLPDVPTITPTLDALQNALKRYYGFSLDTPGVAGR